jgi:anhydro-N-acetylmuramic acid kinase
MALMKVLGLMSGTSMDGVDAAVLETDGQQIGAFGPHLYRPYKDSERALIRAAVADATGLTDRTARPGRLAEAERVVTDAHADAIRSLLAANSGLKLDLIGFHGQTVFHAPERKLTVQIGDGAALAKALGIPVVYDFRAADVEAGGQGAPLVPVYHRALYVRTRFSGSMAVVNIGGVANVTRVGSDGALSAGDTGPGNALIDDLVRERTGAPMDEGGALAAQGTVNERALDALLAHKWFDRPFPKSLDRNAFSARSVSELSTEDAVATLTAFTSRTIVKGIVKAGGADRIVVAGGGANNPALMKSIAADASAPVTPAADLGWSPDFLEAEAFAYLAARSLRRLPLTFPSTTGVPTPMTGGVLVKP